MRPNKVKVFFYSLLLLAFVGGALFLNGGQKAVTAGTAEEPYPDLEVFTEVLRQIEENYVEPQDPKKLIYGAIKGMVQSLDPHSSFMTRDEYQELMLETKGSFTGIGIEITLKDNVLTVVSPIEGTPAYKAGLKAGDKIVQIEGKSTKNMTLMDAVKRIRGPKGTKVKLTILREGEKKPLVFSITRDVIPLKSVRALLLEPGIGYVRISTFQSKTSKDLDAAIKKLEKEGKGDDFNKRKPAIDDLPGHPACHADSMGAVCTPPEVEPASASRRTATSSPGCHFRGRLDPRIRVSFPVRV